MQVWTLADDQSHAINFPYDIVLFRIEILQWDKRNTIKKMTELFKNLMHAITLKLFPSSISPISRSWASFPNVELFGIYRLPFQGIKPGAQIFGCHEIVTFPVLLALCEHSRSTMIPFTKGK